MTTSRWARLAGTSLAAAAIAATAQVGVVHGLGIIDWNSGVGGSAVWRDLLTWLVFIFAAAVLAGVGAAKRGLRAIRGPRISLTAGTITSRAVATVCAGLGSALAFPLVWVPARELPRGGSTQPEVAVLTAAGAGLLLGVVLAFAALSARPIAVNLAITVAWVWVFALTSAGLAMSQPEPLAPIRLGLLDAPQVRARTDLWFSPFLMVGLAAVFGLAVAGAGRWLKAHRLGVTLSGLAGPALVATAYLVAGTSGEPARLQPYLASLIAATVGLLASTGIAAGQRVEAKPADQGIRALTGRRPRLAIEAAPLPAYADPAYRAADADRPAISATPHPVPDQPTPPAAPPSLPAKASKAPAKATKAPAKRARKAARPTVPAQPRRVLVAPDSEEHKALTRAEREHIGWMENLVNTPPDPNLTPRSRG